MPATPIMEATLVCQSALFILASEYSSLSLRTGASLSLARPSSTGGTAIAAITPIMNQPSQMVWPNRYTVPTAGCSAVARPLTAS